MQKCLIFLTLLFSMSLWASPEWNPYFMNHERFVHLSTEEKERVIVKTMEMIVELEGQHRKAVVNSDSQREFREKYFTLLNNLRSLVMSDAYADEIDPAFHGLAKEFSSLLTDLGTKGCLYAGYVSRLVGNYCSAPHLLKGSDPLTKRIKGAYLTKTASAKEKCNGPKQISCNPVVFGYQKNSSKVPFCVAGGLGDAHNSAYDCMKLALSDKSRANTDSKDDRLSYLINALSDSSTAPAFDAAHKFIFRTCVCGDTDLNQTYKEYMRPHRTCFGMLNTLREIESKECSALGSDSFMAAFGSEWSNFYGAQSFSPQTTQKRVEFDIKYGNIITGKEVEAMCSGDDLTVKGSGPKDGEDCVTKCIEETVDEKKVVNCTIEKVTITKTVNGKESVSEILKFKEPKQLLEKGVSELTYESEAGTSHVCKVEDPRDADAEEKLSCILTKSGDDPTKPIITLAFTGLKEGQDPKITWSGADGAVDEKDPKVFNATSNGEKKTLTATFEMPASDRKAEKPSVTTDRTEATVSTKASHVAEKAGASTPHKEEAKAEAAASDNSCTIDLGDDSLGKKFAIKATPEAATPTTVKVNAVVTITGGDEKLPEDYVIVWVRKDYKGPKTPEVKEKKAAPSMAAKDKDAPAEPVAPKEEEKPAEEAPAKKGVPGSPTSDIDEIRLAEKYGSCAHLLDGKGAVVAKDCAAIPPISAPSQNPGMSRPPQFMSPAYNTRTMGIQ